MKDAKPDQLLPLIEEIETHIKHHKMKDHKVSKVDIGWQLDHMLQVLNKVSRAVIDSDPEGYKYKFNLGRSFILLGGYIPRGVAGAPEVVSPTGELSIEDLKREVASAKQYVEQMKPLPKHSNFTHFAFGQMNKSQSIRFMQVHTLHHLKIVRDILKSQ